MGFRATWKEDLQATTAEMIYGAPGNNAASLTPDDPTSRSPYHLREQGFGHMQSCLSVSTDSLKPPYEGPYKVVDCTEKVIRISRHGKEVSVNIDRLKPAYIPKELVDIPVEVNVKKKVSLQPEGVPDSGEEKPRESSSRQETTTRFGRRVRFNPKYS
ncbi:retrovirus-related Pol polyprotein from transposon 412 [Nephila pilipes]|uniref:Retrovirus-related Pol polyprotein from transposon 412 n=1 Tax=Nephila pilipes TaxID=299642 RepID=A0A8X6N662_NEPPI|nr:retrovirus-related Pol polyprotein from transposon 412 [Nephila pilipes]